MAEEYAKHFDSNGYPVDCMVCGSTEFTEEGHIHIEIYVCEYDVVCRQCGSIAAHWAYGAFVGSAFPDTGDCGLAVKGRTANGQ